MKSLESILKTEPFLWGRSTGEVLFVDPAWDRGRSHKGGGGAYFGDLIIRLSPSLFLSKLKKVQGEKKKKNQIRGSGRMKINKLETLKKPVSCL